MPILQTKQLYKSFSGLEVLKNIDLEVETGEVIAIVGPSGSGKSTLLRCLNLMEIPTSGEVYFKDQELTSASESEINEVRQHIGMVFQHFHLFPHLSVLENLTISPKLVLGMDEAEAEAKAELLLKKVDLYDKINSYPAQLSGGQKQRVAIARALAMESEYEWHPDKCTHSVLPAFVHGKLSRLQKQVVLGSKPFVWNSDVHTFVR